MEDIWQQFHRLPKAIRDSVARPGALATIEQLENQYPDLDLATFVMRAMVKEFPATDMVGQLSREGKLETNQAQEVVAKLENEVFDQARDYLGLPMQPSPAPQPQAVGPMAKLEPAAVVPTAPKQEPPTPTKPMAAPAPASPAPAMPPLPKPPAPAPEPDHPTGPLAPTEAYSDDEAKEIEVQAKRLQQMTAPAPTMDFDSIAQAVISQQQLAFRDELLTKRALSVFKARLKDIRDSDETLNVLTRDPKVGGLGLDPDLAKNVVSALDAKAKEFQKRGMSQPPIKPPPPSPPKIPIVKPTRPEPKPPLNTVLPPPNLPVVEKPLPNVTEPPKIAPPIKRPPDIPAPAPMPASPPKPAAQPKAQPVVQRSRVLDRPNMADISRPRPPASSKTYGPAEEMRSMSLAEFRRMGQGATDSARRILEKFKHLQDESFRLWSEAVSGWRQSSVYQLYLDMGRQSLEENISIKDVIQRRATAGEPYLSEHEFSALADMNRQLHA